MMRATVAKAALGLLGGFVAMVVIGVAAGAVFGDDAPAGEATAGGASTPAARETISVPVVAAPTEDADGVETPAPLDEDGVPVVVGYNDQPASAEPFDAADVCSDDDVECLSGVTDLALAVDVLGAVAPEERVAALDSVIEEQTVENGAPPEGACVFADDPVACGDLLIERMSLDWLPLDITGLDPPMFTDPCVSRVSPSGCVGVPGTVDLFGLGMVDVSEPMLRRSDDACGPDGIGLRFLSLQPVEITGTVQYSQQVVPTAPRAAVDGPIDVAGRTAADAAVVQVPAEAFSWLDQSVSTYDGYETCVPLGATPDGADSVRVSVAVRSPEHLPRSVAAELPILRESILGRLADFLFDADAGLDRHIRVASRGADGLVFHVGVDEGETLEGDIYVRAEGDDRVAACPGRDRRSALEIRPAGESGRVAVAASDRYDRLMIVRHRMIPQWGRTYDLCLVVSGPDGVSTYAYPVVAPDPRMWRVTAGNVRDRIPATLRVDLDGGGPTCAGVLNERNADLSSDDPADFVQICDDFVTPDDLFEVTSRAFYPDAEHPDGDLNRGVPLAHLAGRAPNDSFCTDPRASCAPLLRAGAFLIPDREFGPFPGETRYSRGYFQLGFEFLRGTGTSTWSIGRPVVDGDGDEPHLAPPAFDLGCTGAADDPRCGVDQPTLDPTLDPPR